MLWFSINYLYICKLYSKILRFSLIFFPSILSTMLPFLKEAVVQSSLWLSTSIPVDRDVSEWPQLPESMFYLSWIIFAKSGYIDVYAFYFVDFVSSRLFETVFSLVLWTVFFSERLQWLYNVIVGELWRKPSDFRQREALSEILCSKLKEMIA